MEGSGFWVMEVVSQVQCACFRLQNGKPTQGQHQGSEIRKPHSHKKHRSLQLTKGAVVRVAYFFYTETKTSRSSSRHASCAGHGGGGWGSGSSGAGRRARCHFQTWPRRAWGLGAGTPLRNLWGSQKGGPFQCNVNTPTMGSLCGDQGPPKRDHQAEFLHSLP